MFMNLRKQLEEQNSQIQEIRNKVFDGFGSDIKNIREGVKTIDERNEKHHTKIREEIRDVRNLVVGMLITIVASVVINIVVQARLNVRAMPEKETVKTEDVRVAE